MKAMQTKTSQTYTAYNVSTSRCPQRCNRGSTLASANRVIEMYEAGAISVHIGQTYALDDVDRAHTELESRRTVGQSILVPTH